MKQIIQHWLKTLSLSFILMITLQSCVALLGSQSDKMMKVYKGQSQEEVYELLGKPAFRRFNRDGEEWEYRRWRSESSSEVTVITFVDHRVSKLDSYYDRDMRPIIRHEGPQIIERPIYNRPRYNDRRRRRHREDYNYERRLVSKRVFTTIKREVTEQPFTDDKIKVLKYHSRYNLFTCDQIRSLLRQFTFSDDKLKALRILSRCIYDGFNSRTIVSEFNLIDRDDAMRILGYED